MCIRDRAEGLKTSLAMFAGDKMDQVIAVGLKEGKSVDDFAVDFRESISGLTADDSVLVLADIVGGSPSVSYTHLDVYKRQR